MTTHWKMITAICAICAVQVLIGSGCATVSSKTQLVTMTLSDHRDTALHIMPFEPPQTQLVAKDRRADGEISTRDATFIRAIKEANPNIYNYTIDVRDLENIRQSIFNSIEATSAFRAVNFAPLSSEKRQPDTLYLIVGLEKAGIVGDYNYYAVLNGTARLEDSKGSILGERPFNIKRMGAMTVAQGKNKAIRDLVKEVGELITSAATSQRK